MSETNDNDFLAECEAKANEAKGIAAKATEGPWKRVLAMEGWDIEDSNGDDVGNVFGSKTADFVAHARTSNPDLADRVLQLVAMIRELNSERVKHRQLLIYAAHTLENACDILEDDDLDEETPEVRKHIIEMWELLGSSEGVERVKAANSMSRTRDWP